MSEVHPALAIALSLLRIEHGVAGTPRVPLGRVVMTPRAQEMVPNAKMMLGLARHQVGDWGLVDTHDAAVNESALRDGGRVMSIYPIDDQNPSTDNAWWIMGSEEPFEGWVTTVLLPNDY